MLALIGGSGLDSLDALELGSSEEIDTPWGKPSAPVSRGTLEGMPILFLPRHGQEHRIPPHCINYRANLWALQECGASEVLGVGAVGGISPEMEPGSVALPHDLVDYTWGRRHSFSDSIDDPLQHVDFATPFSSRLRTELIDASWLAKLPLVGLGIYGVTQGPRLETVAEVERLRRDGCDMVGMTLMPEAGLARELSMDYACVAAIVNWAAGIGGADIHADIAANIRQAVGAAVELLRTLAAARAQGSAPQRPA